MIQDYVVSLDLAKQLYEAGIVVEDSMCMWVIKVPQYGKGIDFSDVVMRMGRPNDKNGYSECFPAPLSSELGELLPDFIMFKNEAYFLSIYVGMTRNVRDWFVEYSHMGDTVRICLADTEANARAKMLLYLKSKELL